MTLLEIRRGLRDERVRRKRSQGLTLDRLQETSGVDRAAIHRIESVDKYPNYEPGMETVTRLVEGMGLTLSSFFAQIERQTDGDLQTREDAIKNPRTLAEKASRGRAGAAVSSDRQVREAVGQALLRAAASLTDAATTRADEPADREVSDARRKKRVRR